MSQVLYVLNGNSDWLTVKPKRVIFKSFAHLGGTYVIRAGVQVIFEKGAVLDEGCVFNVEHERSPISASEWMR